jgi:hypothetical protein
VAARVLLIHDSAIKQKPSPQIEILMNVLNEMGRYWPVAQRYMAILQQAINGGGDSRFSTNTDTKQCNTFLDDLADMRRYVFDSEHLISRPPNHVNMLPRMPSIAPATTPPSGNPEYLEFFDFFNVL